MIDAHGLVLAPGFIDMHNHSSELDTDLDAESQVSQGITTILLGQDGGSAWPIADFLKHRADKPAALNLQTLAGHATIRKEVMGDDYKRVARPEEIERMAALVGSGANFECARMEGDNSRNDNGTGALQGPAFRPGDHRAVCAVVSQIQTELTRSGPDDGRAGSRVDTHYDFALGPAVRAGV